MAVSFTPSDLCDDLICCSICFEPYTDSRVPKALPCLHTFCVGCLKGSIKVHRTNVQRNFRSRMQVSDFPCPVCKEVTRIPMNGLKGFKDDFRIRRISELLKRQNSQGELIAKGSDSEEEKPNAVKKFCDVCKFSDKEVDAPRYCVECSKLLCEECASKHKDTPISSKHRLISSSKSVPKQMSCKKHHPEPLNIYCKNCGEAVCMTCTMIPGHEGHDLVKVEEECSAVKTELIELLNACKERIPEIQSNLTCFNDLEISIKQKEKNIVRNLRSKFIKSLCKMQAEQSETERELEKLCHKKYAILEGGGAQLEKQLGEMERLVERTENVLEGADAQIMTAQHEVTKGLREFLNTPLPARPDDNKLLDFGTFSPLLEVSRDTDEINDNLDLSGSQASILTEIRDVMAEMRSLSTRTMATEPQLVACLGSKGSEVGQFNFPSSVSVLGNGDVIVADLHNDRVQIFNKEGTYLSSFGDDGFHPCGLAITQNGNIAVTDCKQNVNCVKVFNRSGKLLDTLGKGEFSYPFSIAIDSKNRLIVTDPSLNKVIVLQEDGKVCSKFNTRSRFCFYLTVNKRDEILVSDWYHHCINVFNVDGHLTTRIGAKGYGDGQLMIPLGITIDTAGDVYVLDCKCERVSKFRADGTFVCHHLEKAEGLVHCRAIAMCPQGNLLITCGDNKRDVPNEVRIYKLQ